MDTETIVVPVPDTSKAAADAMAYKLKVPSLEVQRPGNQAQAVTNNAQ